MTNEELEQAKTFYCEKYGIVQSTLKGNNMVYYTSHIQSRITYKVTVDLANGTDKRKELQYYYKKGEANMYL